MTATSCEICASPTVYNLICIEVAKALTNGTKSPCEWGKHYICRPCEKVLIARRATEPLWPQFGQCPRNFTNEDRTMVVLAR